MAARKLVFRILLIGVVTASVLVPAVVAPAVTVSVPTTLARTVRLDGRSARVGHERIGFAFAPTHIAFSWRGGDDVRIFFRTVASGTTSDWIPAPQAHDVERGDRHFTGVVSVDRPDAIRWRAKVSPGTRFEDPILDYLNTLDGPRVEHSIPATAAAAARTPDVVTRAEWGANESLKRTSGGCRRVFYPVQQLFVHHTAGSNFDSHPRATMRAIYHYHVVRQGWCDVGYNFVIAPNGQVFEGRWARRYGPWEVHDSEDRSGRAVSGAHVANYNSGSVGISLMGNYSKVAPSPAMRRTLAEVLAWEADRHDLRPRGRHTYRNPSSGLTRRLPFIAGHRDAGQTECPGNIVYSALPAIRRDAAAVMGAGKLDSTMTFTASASKVDHGSSVVFSGTLANERGLGLANRPMRSYLKKAGSSWKPGPEAVTAPDGTFSFTLEPGKNVRVVAIYDGDAGTWGAESRRVGVKVAPTIELQTEGGTLDDTGIAHFPPETEAVPFLGDLDPAHRGSAVTVRIAELQSDGTYQQVDEGEGATNASGTFRFVWEVDDASGGSFRAFALFPADDDHARAFSEGVFFVIDPSP